MKLITSLKYGKYSNGPRVCIPEHPCLEDFFKFVNSTFDPNQAHDFDSLYLRLSLIVAAQRGSSFFLKQKEKIQYSLHRTLLPREIINKIMKYAFAGRDFVWLDTFTGRMSVIGLNLLLVNKQIHCMLMEDFYSFNSDLSVFLFERMGIIPLNPRISFRSWWEMHCADSVMTLIEQDLDSISSDFKVSGFMDVRDATDAAIRLVMNHGDLFEGKGYNHNNDWTFFLIRFLNTPSIIVNPSQIKYHEPRNTIRDYRTYDDYGCFARFMMTEVWQIYTDMIREECYLAQDSGPSEHLKNALMLIHVRMSSLCKKECLLQDLSKTVTSWDHLFFEKKHKGIPPKAEPNGCDETTNRFAMVHKFTAPSPYFSFANKNLKKRVHVGLIPAKLDEIATRYAKHIRTE